ncbi:hypothetical protein DITRI_Ditri19aG0076100 [Diplodiscus trichospermus]
MSHMSSPVVALFLSFSLLLSLADAFNITEILSPYPDFTIFNNYLIQTGVAPTINSKQTITVLVVANGNMSVVSGLSPHELKKTLSVHVLLDYFDVPKLQNIDRTTVTSLYQQSGLAQNQQGFVNVSNVGKGESVVFGSASPGSKPDSVLVKTISTQPYNISVLQISNIINVSSNSTTSSVPPTPVLAVSPVTPSSTPAPGPAVFPITPSSSPSLGHKVSPITPSSSPAPGVPTVSPTTSPIGSPPRKALAPGPSDKKSPAASPSTNSNNATAPSADTPTALGPAGSPSNPVAEGPGSPSNSVANAPLSPSNPVADGPGSDKKSSAVSVTSRNYLLASMIFTSACFLLTMI